MTTKSMSNPAFPDTLNHEYANLFVAEYIQEDCIGHTIKDGPSFATWCVGPVRNGIFYGIQVSSSGMLPDFTEAIVVDLKECGPSTSKTDNMPDYFLDLEVDKQPRESSKLHFQLRSDLPAEIRLDIIKAQEAHRNFGRAILKK